MAAIHCYSVTNYIHFTQQRRVYYSQKQIGFRSSMTWTFKWSDKLEMCPPIGAINMLPTYSQWNSLCMDKIWYDRYLMFYISAQHTARTGLQTHPSHMQIRTPESMLKCMHTRTQMTSLQIHSLPVPQTFQCRHVYQKYYKHNATHLSMIWQSVTKLCKLDKCITISIM